MSRVVVTEFVTLDGVMEDPGGGEKYPYGGWSWQFWNDEAAKYKFEELFSSGSLLLGRITYEGFAAAWPTMTDDTGFSDRMNSLPKFVASTTLKDPIWNASVIEGDVVEEVSRLRQQPGQDILVAGSAKLVETLVRNSLVDEYRLMLHPVVVGGGKRLFRDGLDTTLLKLVDVTRFESGVVILTYQPSEAAQQKGAKT